MPKIIRTFGSTPSLKNRCGETAAPIIPMISIDIAYSARLSISDIVVTVPDMPSRIMKKALAGCPPVADGVIAEKKMSAVEYM